MAAVRLAVLVRHHAHDLIAPHLGLKRTTDATVSASRQHRMLWCADLNYGFLVERCGWASLHAGATRDTFRTEEVFLHSRRHDRIKAAAGNRQRKCALDLLAGAHAPRTDDAFRRIIGEIRV